MLLGAQVDGALGGVVVTVDTAVFVCGGCGRLFGFGVTGRHEGLVVCLLV